MPLVCRQCSRVNPEEAYYCFFDGVALAGRAVSEGPIDLGAQPFPGPFVFPSGIECRNFDQLATACQQHWDEAVGVLKDGFFAAFFRGLGRADLSRAAKDAAAFPDANRGLDQLLGKLPSQSLESPKLRVEPTEINLGQLAIGVNRGFELALENQGMRLIYGTVTSDVPWLALPGEHSTKSFELTDELRIPIQVRGASLRARLKLQEGHLIVESNAGNFLIAVAIEVPPIPFAEGVLKDARSPRQIAERAKANPNGSAPLFESGAVSRWFAANGLVYPVQGRTAPGVAGVQQFFEALGLAKPPKVEFEAAPIDVEGKPGQVKEFPITVSTQEKKLVYAYATADQPWIDGDAVKLGGRTCVVQLKVVVPPRPGEMLEAKVTVHANGGQRFAFPVRVAVRGTKPPPPLPAEKIEASFTPVADKPPRKRPPSAILDTGEFVLPSSVERYRGESKGDPDLAFAAPPPLAALGPRRSRSFLHAAPAAALVVALLAVVARDYFSASADDDVDPRERLALRLDWSTRGEKGVTNSLMFGLQDRSGREDSQLTFSSRGQTNSVVLSIDRKTRVFGKVEHGRPDGPLIAYKDKSRVATWIFPDDAITVAQHVQIVPGEPIEISNGVFRRYYDTCLVRYTIQNRDTKPHVVGLRFLLDTYIGKTDAPLFALPGRSGIVRAALDLHGPDVPDYIQALEFPDLKTPGTIAQLNLRLGGRIEFPSRVTLTQYPGWNGKNEFEVPVANDPAHPQSPRIGDSAVVVYWKAETLEPGKSRELGFTYGAGNVGGLAELTILNPGPVVQGSEFSLVALVADVREGSEASISLPDGLELAAGSSSRIAVPPPAQDREGRLQPSPVTWTIRAPVAGRYKIAVTVGEITTHRVIAVRKSNVF